MADPPVSSKTKVFQAWVSQGLFVHNTTSPQEPYDMNALARANADANDLNARANTFISCGTGDEVVSRSKTTIANIQ